MDDKNKLEQRLILDGRYGSKPTATATRIFMGVDWARGPDVSVEWTHHAAPDVLAPEPRQRPNPFEQLAWPPKRSPKLADIINAALDRIRAQSMKDITPK